MSEKTLKPGVVTGDGYKTLVEAAKQGGYALPAVNVVGTNSMNAVMEAAAKAKSDIIIQFSNSGGAFYAGAGMADGFKAKVLGCVSAALHAHLLAEHYGICVAMHTDHANKALIPWVEALLDESEKYYEAHGKPLFSSHMLDLSAEPIEYNLDQCARMLERMAKLDMSLEIELGVTGGEEDGIGSEFEEGADNAHLYTQPEDGTCCAPTTCWPRSAISRSRPRSATSTACTSRATSSCARKSSRTRRTWCRRHMAPATTRCTWCSTAAPVPRSRRSRKRCATACSR